MDSKFIENDTNFNLFSSGLLNILIILIICISTNYFLNNYEIKKKRSRNTRQILKSESSKTSFCEFTKNKNEDIHDNCEEMENDVEHGLPLSHSFNNNLLIELQPISKQVSSVVVAVPTEQKQQIKNKISTLPVPTIKEPIEEIEKFEIKETTIPKLLIEEISEEEKEHVEEEEEPSIPKNLCQSQFNIKILKVKNNDNDSTQEETNSASCCASSVPSFETKQQQQQPYHPQQQDDNNSDSSSSTPEQYSPNFNSTPNNNFLTDYILKENKGIQKIDRFSFNTENGFISGTNLFFINFNGPLLKKGINGKMTRIIPEGIKEVQFDFKFNYKIDPLSFPVSVETIVFGSFFNKTIEKDNLPPNLTRLFFGNNFTNGDKDFSSDALPNQRLVEMGFGHCFNRTLDINTVPLSVKKLKLGCYVEHTTKNEYRNQSGAPILKKVGKLPSHIQFLSMGNCFDQRITIPPNIKVVLVKSNYSYFQDDIKFIGKKFEETCNM